LFDIPVTMSSPDFDVTVPGGLTKGKEDVTPFVTASVTPIPSKKYFFNVLF